MGVKMRDLLGRSARKLIFSNVNFFLFGSRKPEGVWNFATWKEKGPAGVAGNPHPRFPKKLLFLEIFYI